MASWATLGALEGLGQSVAEMGGQYVKSKIAEDIQKGREARAEERAKAKEAREEARKLTTPVRENATTRRNPTTGAWEIQDANYLNQPLGSSRPLDEWSAAQRDTQEKKDKIATENATLTGKLTQLKIDRAPIDFAQDDEEHRADMGYKKALTGAANARGTKSLEGTLTADTPVNDTDVASALVEEQDDILSQYNLSPTQKMDLTLSAIRDARTSGKDPVDVLRLALPAYVDSMKAKGYKFKSPTKD